MTTMLERFREKTRRWIKSEASGWEYEITGLNYAQGTAALDAMFALLNKPIPVSPNGNGLKADEPSEANVDESSRADAGSNATRKVTPEQFEAIKHRFIANARACVKAVRFDGIEQRPAPAVEEFPGGDLGFINQEIVKAEEIPEEIVESARGVL